MMPYVIIEVSQTYERKNLGASYLEIHFLKLLAPSHEKRRTDIEMELREGVGALSLFGGGVKCDQSDIVFWVNK